MDYQTIMDKHGKFLFPSVINYHAEPIAFEKAKGMRLTDVNGVEYLDFFGGILTVSLGHCHEEINERMVAEIRRQGGRVDGVLVCPHTPDDDCQCRKPRPGLLLEAAKELDCSLSTSYIIGDSLDDLAAGRAVGCSGILVLTVRGLQELRDKSARHLTDYYLAPNLLAAARWVLEQEG